MAKPQVAGNPAVQRFIFINNTLETFTPTRSGALATVIWECCQVAAARGHFPIVITRCHAGESFNWPALHFIKPPRLPTTRAGILMWRIERKLTGWRHLRHRTYAKRVVNAISKINGDCDTLILFNEPETAVLLRQKFPSARIVHWFQNQLECKKKFRREFAAAADVVLGVSDFTSRWVEQYYGLATASVKTVYNGVDLQQFQPGPAHCADSTVIEFVGRTGIEKGPDLLLNAALLLKSRGRDFCLRLIGSNHWDRFELDEYQRKLAGIVKALVAAGVNVDQPGHVGRADLPGEMRKAHIHVVPARWDEPFGMTTLEGMACGLAVVASKTGGTPEVLGDSGLYFERESVGGLAEQLDYLLTNPTEIARLSEAARKRAQQFSWAAVWENLSAAIAPG